MTEEEVIKAIYGLDYPLEVRSVIHSLEDIVFTSECQSSALLIKKRPILYLNMEDIETHCKSKEHLFMLVMHEAYHLLLGHKLMTKGVLTKIDNICFDAMINARLCREYPKRKYRSFFTGLYEDYRFPELLLRPVGKRTPKRFRDILHRLYSTDQVSYMELRKIVEDELNKTDTPNKIHPEKGQGKAENPPSKQGSETPMEKTGETNKEEKGKSEEAKDHDASRPKHNDAKPGYSLTGHDGQLYRLDEKEPLNISEGAFIEMFIKNFAAISKPKEPKWKSGSIQTYSYSPEDRRAAAKLALSKRSLPLFNKEISFYRKTKQREKRTLVYLDVSGSNVDYLKLIFPTLNRLFQGGVIALYAFSTKIRRITSYEAKTGQFPVGGGTDINQVFNHFHNNPRLHKLKKLVIVTDGCFGEISEENKTRNIESKLQIGIILTSSKEEPPTLGVPYKSKMYLEF